jgi:hypothetical protein
MNAEVYTHASDKVPGGQWILIKISNWQVLTKHLNTHVLNKQIKQLYTDMLAIIEICFYEI